jgi:hypothetical protein
MHSTEIRLLKQALNLERDYRTEEWGEFLCFELLTGTIKFWDFNEDFDI